MHTSSEKTGSLVFFKESIIFGVGTETQVVQSQVVTCALCLAGKLQIKFWEF